VIFVSQRSSSHEQQAVEAVILNGLTEELGVVAPRSLVLPNGARVDVDGVSDDESVLVEVFAHQGVLRGGQYHKVARDALKLITLARTRPAARLVLAFGDEVAARCVMGKSWLAEALRTWGVEVRVVELDAATRAELVAAQVRQMMVNPPDEA
jgi:hypothetical protein